MENIDMNIALLFILFFLLITFFMSFFEKICDYPGTKSFMESHFKNTFLAKKNSFPFTNFSCCRADSRNYADFSDSELFFYDHHY